MSKVSQYAFIMKTVPFTAQWIYIRRELSLYYYLLPKDFTL